MSRSVEIDATGDDAAFRASLDLATGWEGYYRSWNRVIESPNPEVIVIQDRYELATGDGVAFLWNTALPVLLEDGCVIIQGDTTRVTLTPSGTDSVAVEELPLPESPLPQKRISFIKKGMTGSLTITARLSLDR